MMLSHLPVETAEVARPRWRGGDPGRGETLVTESFGLTDLGMKRSTNDDQFLIASLARALWIQQSSVEQRPIQYADAQGELFVVADGMGGNVGGAEASALALGALADFLLDTLQWLFALGKGDDTGDIDVLEDFKAALRRADAQVCEAAARQPELAGMGTTLTMAYAHGSALFLAHVGDSRAYLFRGQALHQLTRDHTLVQELIACGALPAERAADHRLRHIITNVVGGPTAGVQVEVHRLDLEAGDVLLLCTDGLTEMLTDERIAEVLRLEESPRAACERLVRLANERGGRDNVTVVVTRYDLAGRSSRIRARVHRGE